MNPYHDFTDSSLLRSLVLGDTSKELREELAARRVRRTTAQDNSDAKHNNITRVHAGDMLVTAPKKDVKGTCARCRNRTSGDKIFSRVDGNNRAITANAPTYCFSCYVHTYGSTD